MTNLERAIKDGYAHIIGEKGKEKITYVSSDNHVENYSDPEEKVRAEFWAELIYKYLLNAFVSSSNRVQEKRLSFCLMEF